LVILSNLSGTPVPQIVAFNVYDRLLGLDFVPWNKRIKEEVEKAKKEAEKAKKESDRDRKLNTKPSHSIEDYAGDYSHPGYGIVKIEMEGGQPKAIFNSIEYPMNHYHYDIFEAKNEFLDVSTKISFFTDEKGNIGSLSVQLEPNVDPIVFNRMPEKKMMEKDFLEKFTGEYNLMDKTLTVFLKGEDTLFLSIPGQPEYELVPYKGTEFNLKNFSGYSVEFIMDESGNVVEVKIKQPEGVFTAKKKE